MLGAAAAELVEDGRDLLNALARRPLVPLHRSVVRRTRLGRAGVVADDTERARESDVSYDPS